MPRAGSQQQQHRFPLPNQGPQNRLQGPGQQGQGGGQRPVARVSAQLRGFAQYQRQQLGGPAPGAATIPGTAAPQPVSAEPAAGAAPTNDSLTGDAQPAAAMAQEEFPPAPSPMAAATAAMAAVVVDSTSQGGASTTDTITNSGYDKANTLTSTV